jgi:hypothetical protein
MRKMRFPGTGRAFQMTHTLDAPQQAPMKRNLFRWKTWCLLTAEFVSCR